MGDIISPSPITLSDWTEAREVCKEHLKTPPFSDPTTNKFLSSLEKDKQVPDREKKKASTDHSSQPYLECT